MKKTVSIILAILTVCSLFVFPVGAYNQWVYTENLKEGPFIYTLGHHPYLDDRIEITGIDGSLSGEVIIPEKIAGVAVRIIGSKAFMNNKNITKVICKANVTIYYQAFKGCTNLKAVELKGAPSMVQSGAFDDCTNLEVIHIYGKVSQSTKDRWGKDNINSIDKVHEVVYTEKEDAKCSQWSAKKEGREAGRFCNGCNKYLEGGQVIPAEHINMADDGKCDRCGDVCAHKCHMKLQGIAAFFWKIELFFWKIFKMNPKCICGAAHY